MNKNIVQTLLLLIFVSLFISACNSKTELPFTLSEGNRIVLEADVNGKRGRYFWDTGSFVSLVNCKTDNLKVAYYGSLALSSASNNLTYYTLNKIKINNKVLYTESEVCKVTDSLQEKVLIPEGLDGLLGINIFEGYWCEVNFEKLKIILTKNKPENFKQSVSTTLENNYLTITADIDGIATRFVIDTGFNLTMGFPDSILQKKTKTDIFTVATSEIRDYSLIHINEISLFNKNISNRYVLTNTPYSQIGISGGYGVIGLNFLKNYNLLFDLTSLRLLKTTDIYYQPINTMPKFMDLMGKIPESGIINAYRIPEGLKILYIMKEKQLYQKGVLSNSIITKVNNIAIADYSPKQVVDMLNTIGTTVLITVMTNNIEKDIEYIIR